MLFLFNDVVFDLGDLVSLLNDGSLPLPVAELDKLEPGQLMDLVREAIFTQPDLPHVREDQTRHLCALLAYRIEGANGLLAIKPDEATHYREVGLRFANIPMVVLAGLWASQVDQGRLSVNEVNSEVWLRTVEDLRSTG